VLGAAFKPDSDDVRDSPALWVAGELHLAGAQVSVYDPKANANAAKRFPTLTYVDSAVAACQDADLVLHLTEWPEFRALDPAELGSVVRNRRVLDGRNLLDANAWRDAGWEFRSMGRR
jgi:UDPglucose 6-dehydrogenase